MSKSICSGKGCGSPAWIRGSLLSAGFIGLFYAVWTICWPELWFKWSHMSSVTYREMWMTVGMLNGVLGIGLLLASTRPFKHWPNVLISFIAKVGACIGFCWACYRGVFPLGAGWVILVNDFIWIPPLTIILWHTVQIYAGSPPSRDTPYSLTEALESYSLETGDSLLSVSQNQPVAVVFLRHFGCTFTRKLLRELDQLKQTCEQNGVRLVLVHMLQHGEEKSYLTNNDVSRISDPYCELYRAFGLGKGGVFELFGPRVIVHGIFALVKGCGVGHLAGDGFQLPGAFLVEKGEITSAQRARTAADLPQLDQLLKEG